MKQRWKHPSCVHSCTEQVVTCNVVMITDNVNFLKDSAMTHVSRWMAKNRTSSTCPLVLFTYAIATFRMFRARTPCRMLRSLFASVLVSPTSRFHRSMLVSSHTWSLASIFFPSPLHPPICLLVTYSVPLLPLLCPGPRHELANVCICFFLPFSLSQPRGVKVVR